MIMNTFVSSFLKRKVLFTASPIQPYYSIMVFGYEQSCFCTMRSIFLDTFAALVQGSSKHSINTQMTPCVHKITDKQTTNTIQQIISKPQ